MTSSSDTGTLEYNTLYMFNNDLNIVYAKEYDVSNGKWVNPLSLKKSVCNRVGNGVIIDHLTNKDAVVDYEVIPQGFLLKGVDNVSVGYISNEVGLQFIREDSDNEAVIDEIESLNGIHPNAKTVFFMKLKSINNIIFLISWGSEYYKTYGYTHNKSGILTINSSIVNNRKLSGHDMIHKSFKYKNISAIKTYLENKFNLQNRWPGRSDN